MPIHTDPIVAGEAGFDRPIAHRLNTTGLACRAVLKRYARGNPERIGAMARCDLFRPPSRAIRSGSRCSNKRFRAWAVGRQVLVLDRGECRLPAG
jgi:hypothetical protein